MTNILFCCKTFVFIVLVLTLLHLASLYLSWRSCTWRQVTSHNWLQNRDIVNAVSRAVNWRWVMSTRGCSRGDRDAQWLEICTKEKACASATCQGGHHDTQRHDMRSWWGGSGWDWHLFGWPHSYQRETWHAYGSCCLPPRVHGTWATDLIPRWRETICLHLWCIASSTGQRHHLLKPPDWSHTKPFYVLPKNQARFSFLTTAKSTAQKTGSWIWLTWLQSFDPVDPFLMNTLCHVDPAHSCFAENTLRQNFCVRQCFNDHCCVQS